MTSSDDMLYCYLLDIVSHLQLLSHRCQLSFKWVCLPLVFLLGTLGQAPERLTNNNKNSIPQQLKENKVNNEMRSSFFTACFYLLMVFLVEILNTPQVNCSVCKHTANVHTSRRGPRDMKKIITSTKIKS